MGCFTSGGAGFALVTRPSDSDSGRAALDRVPKPSPLRELGAGHRDRSEILLAEVLNTIVEQANCGGEGGIRLLLQMESGRLCLVVEDEREAMPGGDLPAGTLPDAASLPDGASAGS